MLLGILVGAFFTALPPTETLKERFDSPYYVAGIRFLC